MGKEDDDKCMGKGESSDHFPARLAWIYTSLPTS